MSYLGCYMMCLRTLVLWVLLFVICDLLFAIDMLFKRGWDVGVISV